MKLNSKTCKLVADLEELIGSQCYNPNSYDGWNDIEGCSFRYPVHVPNAQGRYLRSKININRLFNIEGEEISPSSVEYMKYRFGSNELFVGKGLLSVLSYLEERYHLDFTELEEELYKQE